MNSDFIDGYLQALLDIEESTKFGAKYQQFYREKTRLITLRLKGRILKKYEEEIVTN